MWVLVLPKFLSPIFSYCNFFLSIFSIRTQLVDDKPDMFPSLLWPCYLSFCILSFLKTEDKQSFLLPRPFSKIPQFCWGFRIKTTYISKLFCIAYNRRQIKEIIRSDNVTSFFKYNWFPSKVFLLSCIDLFLLIIKIELFLKYYIFKNYFKSSKYFFHLIKLSKIFAKLLGPTLKEFKRIFKALSLWDLQN